MKRKTLSQTNPHLRDTEAAKRRLIRSIASSTAGPADADNFDGLRSRVRA